MKKKFSVGRKSKAGDDSCRNKGSQQMVVQVKSGYWIWSSHQSQCLPEVFALLLAIWWKQPTVVSQRQLLSLLWKQDVLSFWQDWEFLLYNLNTCVPAPWQKRWEPIHSKLQFAKIFWPLVVPKTPYDLLPDFGLGNSWLSFSKEL